MRRPTKLGLVLMIARLWLACDSAEPLDAGASDVGSSLDGGHFDGGLDDVGATCTSTVIPPSAPAVTVTPPYGYALPTPSGPYAVGTRIFYLHDPSRLEPRTAAVGDVRELVVQAFYPSDVRSGPPAPIMEPALEGHFGRQGLPRGFNSHLRTNAIFDVPVAAAAGVMPVVFYTHGLQGFRFENQALLEELASRGYFVVTLSIVYSSTLVVREDGTSAPTTVPALPRTPAEELAFFQGVRARMDEDWLPDLRFMLDQLGRWNADPCSGLTSRIDPQRVVLSGYSFGGASSIELCLADSRCAGAVSFDGPMFSSDPASTEKPIMILLSDRSDLSWVRMSEQLTGDIWQVRILGSAHANNAFFGSLVKALLPVVDLEQLGYGSIDPDRSLSIIHSYAVAFVEHALSGRIEPLLLGPAIDFPETIYEDATDGVWSDPFSIFGQVILDDGAMSTPVVGAHVTAIGSATSTTSDRRGRYRLDGLTGAGLVGARIEDPSVFPGVVSLPSRGRNLPELPVRLFSPARLDALATSAQVTLDPNLGHVAIIALRTVAEQSVYEETGVRIGSTSVKARTVYTSSTSGVIDPRLTATDNGLAFVFNVPPGTWTATVAHPSLSCFALPGGPPERTGEVDAIVEAGAISVRVIGCE